MGEGFVIESGNGLLMKPSLEFSQLVQTLVQHKYRAAYLASILLRMQLDDAAWIQVEPIVLWAQTSAVTDAAHPAFYTLPHEMMAHANGIRLNPEFACFRDWVTDCIASRTLQPPLPRELANLICRRIRVTRRQQPQHDYPALFTTFFRHIYE